MPLASKRSIAAALAAAFASTALAAEPPPQAALASFASEAELVQWLDSQRDRLNEQIARDLERKKDDFGHPPFLSPIFQLYPGDSALDKQSGRVEEGGIVKGHGQTIVVMRRGRLFTISTANNKLAAVSVIDAHDKIVVGDELRFLELFVHGDTVATTRASNRYHGSTEVRLFDIDAGGRLQYRSQYHVRSSFFGWPTEIRLIDGKLVIYSPEDLRLDDDKDPLPSFPGMRKWEGDVQSGELQRIAPATRIHRLAHPPGPWGLKVHAVTVCDLARSELECRATAVIADGHDRPYFSRNAVYVWSQPYDTVDDPKGNPVLLRIPLDGSAATALTAGGTPIDADSFHESDDGHLNVLLYAPGIRAPRPLDVFGTGVLQLMRVPLTLFGDGRGAVPASAYRSLPAPYAYTVRNRFIGPWLLYGGTTERNSLHALRWAEQGTLQSLGLSHGIDRIVALGKDALVLGGGEKGIEISSVKLGDQATIPFRFTMRPHGATQTRHFFGPPAPDAGVLAMSVTFAPEPKRPGRAQGSAKVVFFGADQLALGEVGEVSSSPVKSAADGCKAPCGYEHWFSNARPLYLGGRYFALLGYEMVEFELYATGPKELRRLDFAPRALRQAKPPSSPATTPGRQ